MTAPREAREREADRVMNGELCARCKVEFDGAHQTPVLCHSCHSTVLPSHYLLSKAWLEEKAK